jgi:cytochrome P450
VDDLAASAVRFITDPHSQQVGDLTMFARLAVEKPVLKAGPVWIVSRHDLVCALARHPACVVRLPDRWRHAPPLNPSVSRLLEGLLPVLPTPDHRRLRRLLAGQFSARSVERLRGAVVRIVTELLAGPLRRGSCDFVKDVCLPLPVYTTAALLGLPDADRGQLLAWAQAVNGMVLAEVTGRVGGAGGGPRNPGVDRLGELVAYIEELVRRRTADPGDDLISRLAAETATEDGHLDHDELVSTVLLLLMTGIDTVGSGLANVVTVLGRNREAWALVVADPSRAGAAYQEALRLLPPLPVMSRITEADVEVAGLTIPAASTVLLVYGAANLDPRVFPEPCSFDLARLPTGQLAFGHGPHHCLGASLAVLQGEVVLAALARSAPWFHVGAGPRRRRDELAFHSPAELPLWLRAEPPGCRRQVSA